MPWAMRRDVPRWRKKRIARRNDDWAAHMGYPHRQVAEDFLASRIPLDERPRLQDA